MFVHLGDKDYSHRVILNSVVKSEYTLHNRKVTYKDLHQNKRNTPSDSKNLYL